MEPFEVQIAAVHHIEGARFCDEQIQNIDIVYPSFGNMDEFRDAAAQIQKGMKFDCSLLFPKPCPGKELQTQVYGGGVESIGCLLQLDPKVVVEIEIASDTNQHLRKIRVNAPIPVFVGSGQGASGNPAPNTHMVKPWFHCPKTGFDIAQTFSIGKLRKGHTQKLVQT